jgi:hypothetical protein
VLSATGLAQPMPCPGGVLATSSNAFYRPRRKCSSAPVTAVPTQPAAERPSGHSPAINSTFSHALVDSGSAFPSSVCRCGRSSLRTGVSACGRARCFRTRQQRGRPRARVNPPATSMRWRARGCSWVACRRTPAGVRSASVYPGQTRDQRGAGGGSDCKRAPIRRAATRVPIAASTQCTDACLGQPRFARPHWISKIPRRRPDLPPKARSTFSAGGLGPPTFRRERSQKTFESRKDPARPVCRSPTPMQLQYCFRAVPDYDCGARERPEANGRWEEWEGLCGAARGERSCACRTRGIAGVLDQLAAIVRTGEGLRVGSVHGAWRLGGDGQLRARRDKLRADWGRGADLWRPPRSGDDACSPLSAA